MPAPHIDCHQHFWQLARGDYGWLTEAAGPIYRDFAPADLRPLLAEAGIAGTLLVQAAPTLAETRYLLGLARQTDFVAGVVGWVDMDAPDAIDTLQALAEEPLLKSIRPMIQDIDDSCWMLKPELDGVFSYLADSRLCFDALVKPVHLRPLLALLERYPGLKTVIDHGGKPDIARRAFEPWAGDIGDLAGQTTACCKLSGLLTEARQGAGLAELRPYMAHLLDSFGPHRLMWGSDWPVLNLSNDYRGWRAITEAFLAPLDAWQKDRIFGRNAVDFYDLKDAQ